MYRLIIFLLLIFGVIPFLFWLYVKIKNSKWLESVIKAIDMDADYSKPKTNTMMRDIDKAKIDLSKRAKENEKMSEDAQKESADIHDFLDDDKKSSKRKGGRK